MLDRDLTDDDYPDIALEVIIRSGGINKLEVYQGLGVREVWFWHRGRFRLFELGASGYVEVARSGLVPELDFEVLTSFAEQADQHEALKSYRDRLRQTSG